MSNLMDYLDWRSDVSFETDPFNEVDNLLLCQLSYVNWDGILPEDLDKKVSIEWATKKLFDTYDEEFLMARNTMTKLSPFLLKKMVNTARFGGTKIFGFVNTVDSITQTQFCVMTFILPDDTVFVSFRGTDNTLIGWKEDFNMCYMNATAGQLLALDYVNSNFNNSKRRIRIGGHSKGGNFAVYAAAFCKPNIRKKIIAVYSNDGPGFEKHITESEEYLAVLPKVQSFIPEFSIVGLMMENQYDSKVVYSLNKGLMAHDPLSWQLTKNQFDRAEAVNSDCILLANTVRSCYQDEDVETRALFFDFIFTALLNQSEVVSDITGQPVKTLSELKKSYDLLPEEKQKIFLDMVIKIIKKSQSALVKSALGKAADLIRIPLLPNLSQMGKIKRGKNS